MKRLNKTVASALASASAAIGRTATVIASEVVALPEGIEAKAHVCASCQTTASYNTPQPYCVTCGSDDLQVVDDALPAEEFSDEDEVVSAGCPSCGTHNLMSKASVASLAHQMHCVTCGTEITFQDPDENATTFDPTDSMDLNDDAGTASADDGDDEGEADNAANGPADGAGDFDEVSGDDTELDLVEQAEGDLEVFAGNGKVFASIGDIPVSVLDEENAGDNAEVMFSTAFMSAVKAAVKTQGVQALATFGFQPIRVKLNLAKLIDKQVTAGVQAETAKMEQAKADLRADYAHALQIAGVGLNKGFFANRSNPLKAALFDVLTQAGVRNAAPLIDTAFASVGEAFTAELLDTTEEVLDKSPELRDELAATLRTTNYQKAEAVESDDDEEADEVDEIVARASGAGLKRSATASLKPTDDGTLFGR